jgi:hypothetical protein
VGLGFRRKATRNFRFISPGFYPQSNRANIVCSSGLAKVVRMRDAYLSNKKKRINDLFNREKVEVGHQQIIICIGEKSMKNCVVVSGLNPESELGLYYFITCANQEGTGRWACDLHYRVFNSERCLMARLSFNLILYTANT